jgi:G3E family GTPase
MSQISNNHQKLAITPPLLLPSDPTVIVFSGWGNAGKTNSIGRALQGLHEDVTKVGVIINERSEASVAIDLNRLPEGFDKVGLQGCSCCSQLPEVLASIEDFKQRGRLHTFIEQGHLSVTSDLRSGLLHAGHKPVVVFLFNPAQYSSEYQCVQFGGIRSADIVVLTHCQSNQQLVERGKKIVTAATGDLKKKPLLLVDSDPLGAFSPEIWKQIVERSLISSKKSFSGIIGSFFGGDGALESHTEELLELRSRYSEESLVPYVSNPTELVQRIADLRERGELRIERVKGFLSGGVDVNIEWVPSSNRYVIDCKDAPERLEPVLAVRTLQGILRPHFPKIVSSFATPDVNPNFIRSVAESYPSIDECRTAVRSGKPPLSFEPDRILLDLVNCRFSMNYLIESHPERFNEMCEALIQLLDASMTTRLNTLLAIHEREDLDTVALEGIFNATYFLMTHLSNENLAPFLEYLESVNAHPLTSLLHEDLGDVFVSAALSLPKIRFEGRKNLSRSEVSGLADLLTKTVRDGRMAQESVSQLCKHWLSPNFQDKDLKAQKDVLLDLVGN